MSTPYYKDVYKDVYKDKEDRLLIDVKIEPLPAEGLVKITYNLLESVRIGSLNIWRVIAEDGPNVYAEYPKYLEGRKLGTFDWDPYYISDSQKETYYKKSVLHTQILHTSKINLRMLTSAEIKMNDMKQYTNTYIERKQAEAKKLLDTWITEKNAEEILIWNKHIDDQLKEKIEKQREHTQAWFETNNLSLYQKFSNFIKKLNKIKIGDADV